MKKRWLALGLSVVMLLGMTACQKNKGDDTSPTQTTNPSTQPEDNVITGVGTLDGQAYSVRTLDAPDVYVNQIFGLSDGWVNIYGEYKEQTGYFYVNEKGEILNDTVYEFGYPFNNGFAYVTMDSKTWYIIDENGAVFDELYQNPNERKDGFSYHQTTVNGEERWYIMYNGKAISDPIYEWISGLSFRDDGYAVLAEGEHRKVMINYYSKVEVTAVLPDDCTFAHRGENSIIGYFEGDDGETCFGLLSNNGAAMSDYRYDALTHISNWLAVGVQDNRLMLLDEQGAPMMTFDVPLAEVKSDLTAVAFDNDLIAAIGADNELVLLRVEFEEMPLRRRALEMVEKTQEIFFFYLSGDTDYDVDYSNPTQGLDWLHEGSVANYLGKPIKLTGDYKRFEGEVMGLKVDSLDSLRRALETVLTPEAVEKHYLNPGDTYPEFVEYQGKLFRIAADGAYLPVVDRGSVKIVSADDTIVTFTIDVYYHYKGDGDTYRFEMVRTEDGWRMNTVFPGEEIEE